MSENRRDDYWNEEKDALQFDAETTDEVSENQQDVSKEEPEKLPSETQVSSDVSSENGHVTYSWVNPKLKKEGSPDENFVDRIESAAQSNTQSSFNSQDKAPQFSQQNKAWSGYQERPAAQQPGGGYKKNPESGESKKHPVFNWKNVIAMGVVMGLLVGSISYGTFRLGGALFGTGKDASSAAKIGTTESLTAKSATSKDETTAVSGQSTASGTVASVAENAMPAMVTISTMSVAEMQSFFGGTQQYEVQGAGSGVIVGQNDTELLIATNNHVIENAKELSIGFNDGAVVSGAIKGTDSKNDLAVVAVKLADIKDETKNKIKAITIGDSDKLVLGEQVVAIGNALGYGQSVTAGYISAFDRELKLSDGNSVITSSGLIQTDAAINSGNSGGALLNMKGELVGINEAKSSTTNGATVDNMGYSIPISKAEPILENLMKKETKEAVSEEQQGYLGITTANVTEETAEMYNVPVGVIIRSLSKGGAAEKAGAKAGDVIVSLDGTEVSTFEELKKVLSYTKAGDQVEMIVKRANNGEYKEEKLQVTLGDQNSLKSLTEESESKNNGQKNPSGGN